jgi:hypothetical protein
MLNQSHLPLFMSALSVYFTTINSWLGTVSFLVSIGYGVWRWRRDYNRDQRFKKGL